MRSSDPFEPDTPAELSPEPPRPPWWIRRRPGHALETVLLASTACLLAAVAWPIARDGFAPSVTESGPAASTPVEHPLAADAERRPSIQIALLLDTSSSMDGLINQARTQLWSVVNTLDSATFHGQRPQLEIAVYEYGNDGLPAEGGHIRQVVPFSTELDRVSEALFGLGTMGGSEHAGQVIARSLDELVWREGSDVLRVVYIAGNESFQQGPVDSRQAIERAKRRGIVVNTVNCIEGQEDEGWAEAARLAGGRFLRIDQNQVAAYVAAPQDDRIAELGAAINETYIHWGSEGKAGYDNQVRQDENSEVSGKLSFVQRSVSKASHLYRNPSWDLVDALAEGEADVRTIDRKTLPGALRELDAAELEEHVEIMQNRRVALKDELSNLAEAREAFLQAERVRDAENSDEVLGDALIDSIRDQAEAAGFTLDPA